MADIALERSLRKLQIKCRLLSLPLSMLVINGVLIATVWKSIFTNGVA